MANFETVCLEHRDHRADFMEFAVGKDVTLDERTSDLGRSTHPEGDLDLSGKFRHLGRIGIVFERYGTPDGVIQEPSSWTKEIEELLGIGGERFFANVLR